MITLKNVNKYFFRHKRNEIHVINNTSLTLGDTGLVALLGPSGCGKTTLLNAIGGLDKINSGKIYINGSRLPKRSSNKKDKIRVLNIGYIFQNYNLLDNMTVFENVALSLKMIGIKNRAEIKKRVEYILECVGMYRYRNKPAGMLSGGQRQRVGIARAIVKNPDVIIADEPTGNLDSKNTIEIMNIIKSISKDKLVILVTHEKNLAEFYASRIISLEDGKVINDEENVHENELDYRIDNKIYLKDFENTSEVTDENKKIKFYYDKDENVELDIVIRNGNIYIKSKDDRKIEVVDDESGIEFVNDNYKKISKEDYQNSTFDLKQLDNSKHRLRYTSIYNVFTMFKAGFKKVASYTLMKKILLVGFFVSAMFIVYAISNVFGITNIEDSKFVRVHKNYIEIKNNKNSIEDFNKVSEIPGVSYVIPGDSLVNLRVTNDSFFQLKDASASLSGSLTDLSLLDSSTIIHGKYPKESNELILDKMVIDRALQADMSIKSLNLQDYEDYVGFEVSIGKNEYTISGISDSLEPSIYMNKDNFIDVIGDSKSNGGEEVYYDNAVQTENNDLTSNVKKYSSYKDEIAIKQGREPSSEYEVIVNIDSKEAMPLNKTIDMKINNKKLKVVGYYYSKKGVNDYYVSDSTYRYNTILSKSNMMIIATDKEAAIQSLKDAGYNAMDTYESERNSYIEEVKENIVESLVVSGVLLLISFVEIFLMIRASFLSRIKEVGIYRAIGVKRRDIYKMFMGEILIITTIAGLTGGLLMLSILNEITKISFFTGMFMVDARVAITSLVLIYGFNLLVGLLPVANTIRKSPAEILSRNDVD